MSERILYHGTSFDIVGGQVANGKAPLYGKRVLDDPAWSGTLTDDKEFAVRWAHRRGGDPVVLTYSLPENILIDEGVIGMKDSARGFVTTLQIPVSQLPEIYMNAVTRLNRTTKDILEMLVQKGKLSFHAISPEYFVQSEDA